ncbi:MAG: hypothetical protein HRU75_03170 [Planctomycetia bacterium]|nr:MAG: hypothetical protein HRU75_03170 [Planctomycetia bacterium]
MSHVTPELRWWAPLGNVAPHAGGANLKQSSRSGPAIDLDGSVVVANEGYVFVVRPPLADFTGDGCRNNFDVNAFVLALMDPASWHATIGTPGGVNLLGVGDCNNDGVFDNFDIDCFVDLVLCGNPCGCPRACCLPEGGCAVISPGECTAQGGQPGGSGDTCVQGYCDELLMLGEIESEAQFVVDIGEAEDEWTAFWETITWLRAQFAE